jgi:hypothetical protein
VKLSNNLEWIITAGSSGSGNDNFSSPTHSCIAGGYVFTTDTGNHRIIKRDLADLSYIAQTGSYGTGDTNFDSPYGITSDGTYIYVTDKGNHRIVKYTLALTYISKSCHYGDKSYSERLSESGTIHAGDPLTTATIYTDPTWGLASYVVGPLVGGDYHKAIMYGPDADGFAQNVAWQYGPSASGPWTDYQGYGGAPTVVAAYAYTWAATGVAYSANYAYCPVGGTEHLSSPGGIYCDGINICVLDSGNQSVMKRLLSSLSYVARVSLLTPIGYHDVSFGTNYLYITAQPDLDTYFQVARYTYPGLVYVDRKYSSQTTADGWFYRPEGVFVKGAYVYVIESGNCRIQKFNPDLSYITKFGSSGSGVNQFSSPKGITGV